jgi:hypothetical protein
MSAGGRKSQQTAENSYFLIASSLAEAKRVRKPLAMLC